MKSTRLPEEQEVSRALRETGAIFNERRMTYDDVDSFLKARNNYELTRSPFLEDNATLVVVAVC